jgi:hypothetical protein
MSATEPRAVVVQPNAKKRAQRQCFNAGLEGRLCAVFTSAHEARAWEARMRALIEAQRAWWVSQQRD